MRLPLPQFANTNHQNNYIAEVIETATTEFLAQFTPANDLDDVVIDFAKSKVVDHSGISALDTLAERYGAAGKTLHLIHLSPDCKKLLT